MRPQKKKKKKKRKVRRRNENCRRVTSRGKVENVRYFFKQ